MADTSIIKVSSKTAPVGEMGQKYLASGKSLSMRMWEEDKPSNEVKPLTARDYETCGYVISGKAELHFDNDQKVLLSTGDSWIVPKGAKHTYKILETFTAVEATHPPAEVKHRDAPVAK
jgi:quercetin dioxygenase-like cupin family protein